MKTRIKLWLISALTVLALLLSLQKIQAQQYDPYDLAIGLRLGGTSGVTVKNFFKPTMAFEGIVGTFGNGFSLTGLVEKHLPVYNADGFYVYYGGGLHLAFYDGRGREYSYFGHEVDNRHRNDFGLGVNGMLGIEYRLPENIPIAVSLDMKPFLEFGSGGYITGGVDPSLGVKFTIR